MDVLKFGQHWLEVPDPDFAPGEVAVELDSDVLEVRAVLVDSDVFNPVTSFNEPAWSSGDVFETFVRLADSVGYYEFHITPAGQRLQLRWPGPMRDLGIDWQSSDPLGPYKIANPIGEWSVTISPPGWSIHARLPLSAFREGGGPCCPLAVSFGRYDHTRGRNTPVLSSTSPHARPDFHGSSEWHVIPGVE